MFEKKPKAGPIASLVGVGCLIEGNVTFSGGTLRIDGQIKGNVIAEKTGTLILGETGKVQGEINVEHAVIDGTVIGPVRVSKFLEIRPKGKVTGDVYYKSIEMSAGAMVTGQMVCQQEDNSFSNKTVGLLEKPRKQVEKSASSWT